MDCMKYFPEGVAKGEAFVNREAERECLSKRISYNQHSVLIAPRKYGKTSLVMKVAAEMKIAYCAIDFLAAYSEECIRDQLADKVGCLVFDLLPRAAKAKEKLVDIFKKLKPEISLSAFGQRLSLSLSNNSLKDITELLLKLDETAQCFKKRAVIFIDEFQQIGKIKNYHSIEAAIRHAVERSENVAYVFSGSDRGLLEQMFGDQGRPLYRLCHTMSLERMTQRSYTAHLQQLAHKQWGKELSQEVLDGIFSSTELHPFYMNVLCQNVWEGQFPSIEAILAIWREYVETQRRIISYDFMGLSLNQRKIMVALAKTPAKEIQSAEFVSPLKLSASSVQQAVAILMRKDLVYRAADGVYYVLDPAMRYYLEAIL